MSNQPTNNVTLSKKTLGILILLVLLLIAGSVCLGMNWNQWFGGENAETEADAGITQTETISASGSEFSPEVDPNASDWNGTLTSSEEDETESVGIQIPGYPSISVTAGETTVNVALLNPEGNPCYFTFTLVLKDTEEVLYTSGLVPPGQAINGITIARALEAGEYDAVLKITTTSLEDGSAMNGANVETVLIVE